MGFTFNYPNYTIGENAYDEIEKVCLKYGTTAVVIGGKTAMSKAKPFLDNALKTSNINIIDYLWYVGEASNENAHRLSLEESVKKADMIFAVGGGKAIDASGEDAIWKEAAKIPYGSCFSSQNPEEAELCAKL